MSLIVLFVVFLAFALLPAALLTWAETSMKARVPHTKIACVTLAAFFVPPFLGVTIMVAMFLPPVILFPMAFPASTLIWRSKLEGRKSIRRFLTSVNILIFLFIVGYIIKGISTGQLWPEFKM